MNLAFSTKFPNNDFTFFIQKIWNGLLDDGQFDLLKFDEYYKKHIKKIGNNWHISTAIESDKIHTIRLDSKNRWKEGNNIHFIINNRTKDRFQFAPILKVKKVQEINIIWSLDEWVDYEHGDVEIYIDRKNIGSCSFGTFGQLEQCSEEIKLLTINDGFDNVTDFFKWFDKDFNGKLIHWTDKTY